MAKLDYPEKQYSAYPSYRYHEKHDPLIVENEAEDQLLEEEFPDEWKTSPAEFNGHIGAPSQEQLNQASRGFTISDLKKKRAAADKSAQARPLSESSEAEVLSDKNKKKLGISSEKK